MIKVCIVVVFKNLGFFCVTYSKIAFHPTCKYTQPRQRNLHVYYTKSWPFATLEIATLILHGVSAANEGKGNQQNQLRIRATAVLTPPTDKVLHVGFSLLHLYLVFQILVMASEIKATPLLQGKSAGRFIKMIDKNQGKRISLTKRKELANLVKTVLKKAKI
jgi:hypothetical protein